jgi:uncharacterized protein
MSKILIGESHGKNVSLELDVLLRTRLLIQANSGKGKSWLLRRLAEQLFGKVQVIILDPEGEFASLREKFGYVLVGKGGETPADPRSAALVAHKLLELRAPAVCDLYEMKPSSRHEWVQKFFEAMIDAPKNLWHPCIIMLDEAHVFCPEKGAGESLAAESVIGMATRGRKRGFCLVAATQRLGKFRKDAAAEMLNVMIGGTFIDIDRKRAADALGVYGTEQHKFFDEIKLLERGSFYALGPAIADERILLKVGAVETSHPEAGSSKHASEPPPAPEEIAKLLPKLADLPKAAEEKAKTEAQLRTEIRSLKASLRSAPAIKFAEPDNTAFVTRAVEKASREFQHRLDKQLRQIERAFKDISGEASRALLNVEMLKKVSGVEIQKGGEPATSRAAISENRPALASHSHPRPMLSKQPGDSEMNGQLSGPHQKILKALAELASIDKHDPPREMVAAWAGYSPNGGAFSNPLGSLRSMGLIEYPGGGRVKLTDKGVAAAGVEPPPDQEEIHRRILDILRGPERKILSVLLEAGSELSKQELADRAGYSERGGAFSNPLGALRTSGFVEYPRPGVVQACAWLFLE